MKVDCRGIAFPSATTQGTVHRFQRREDDVKMMMMSCWSRHVIILINCSVEPSKNLVAVGRERHQMTRMSPSVAFQSIEGKTSIKRQVILSFAVRNSKINAGNKQKTRKKRKITAELDETVFLFFTFTSYLK
jgi:hypothetical protein